MLKYPYIHTNYGRQSHKETIKHKDTLPQEILDVQTSQKLEKIPRENLSLPPYSYLCFCPHICYYPVLVKVVKPHKPLA